MRAVDRTEQYPASLTIRRLDPAVKERLRARAQRHGRSMEAEARRILPDAVGGGEHPPPPERSLYQMIRDRFEPLGGVDLELPPREPAREPPHFE